jgi:hypothetical protein
MRYCRGDLGLPLGGGDLGLPLGGGDLGLPLGGGDHTDKNEKEEFFSEEFFTIYKEIFPYCQGKIFLPYP